MGTSNGRFLLGLLLGALLGGLLAHFLAGGSDAPIPASAGLSPGESLSPAVDKNVASENRQLPVGTHNPEREVARAQSASVPAALVSDREVQELMAGLAEASAKSASGNGTIHGHVLDEEGQAVPNVVVRLAAQSTRMSGAKTDSVAAGAPVLDSLAETVRKAAERYNESTANRRQIKTNAGGAYSISNLANSKWTVTAYLPGYVLSADGPSRSVRVGSEVDFTATHVIEIPTQVLTPAGTPAETASIMALLVTGSSTRGTSYTWSEQAAFLRLVPGEYEVTAYSPHSGSTNTAEFASESQKITVEAGTTPTKLRLELRGRPGIVGYVNVAKGDPNTSTLRVHLMPLGAQQEVDLLQLANSSQTSSSRKGSEYTFTDLEPGRYVVGAARGRGSPILQHKVVEVLHTKVQCNLDLPALDLTETLRVTVLGSSGEHLNKVRFILTVKRKGSSRSGGMQAMRDKVGSYLLEFSAEAHKSYFGEEADSATFELQANHEDYGPQTVELNRGQTELKMAFVTPGTLEVTVAGYQGSGYEGRLQVTASLKTGDTARNFYSSSFSPSGGNNLTAEGVQTITSLTPGSYTVTLAAKPKGTSDNWFQSNELESIEMEVLPGENSLRMRIPSLYGLRVHDADGKEGSHMSLGPMNGNNPFGNGSGATIDANGYGNFEDLRAGDYILHSQGGQMNISVPCGEVEFEAVKLNALRVTIHDTGGDLAKQGFRNGDLVIGQDGEEFGDEPDFGLLGQLTRSKSVEVNFLVLRGDKRLEILVKGSELGDWQAMGGNMSPAAY